jgi:hypothetical protein
MLAGRPAFDLSETGIAITASIAITKTCVGGGYSCRGAVLVWAAALTKSISSIVSLRAPLRASTLLFSINWSPFIDLLKSQSCKGRPKQPT